MKNALIKMSAFLLVLLLFAGCQPGSSGKTQDDSSQKAQVSSGTEKPTDSSKEESKPAEPSKTESTESPAEEPAEKRPYDLYMEAARISEEAHFGEEGAYGIFDRSLEETSFPMYDDDQAFLYFSDRQYCVESDRESGEVHKVSLHSEGQCWTTAYIYYPNLPLKKLHDSDKDSDLAVVYKFGSLYSYADEIEEAPEQAEYNGVPCWCFTVIRDFASNSYPEGSFQRIRILFRQEDLIFVYASREVITPDGTEILVAERRIMGGKETEEFYQAHAHDLADAESRDSTGSCTLTVVVIPRKGSEFSYRCPVNVGESLQNRGTAGYTLYWDREGTKEVEVYAEIVNAADVTVYMIQK